jgi:hypothetical protein
MLIISGINWHARNMPTFRMLHRRLLAWGTVVTSSLATDN